MMHIYNTLSGEKEPFPRTRGRIKMFVCGPTVYNYIHTGNARTYMNFDIIVRYLRSRGYNIFYLQNITDVDDKIITRAAEEGVPWRTVSRKYEKIYKENLKALNIVSVNKYARATDHIRSIVRQVQTLIEKECAYLIPDDGWYFDLSKFADYGKLSRRTTEQAEDGVSRIDASDLKRNRGDFCLWKFSKPGEPVWKTSLGAGRPGWHIEDTAITEHYFGPQYDIHGAAIDLMFPHHEAEIAQQESASGKKPFVKIWMHCGFLVVGGDKMSKSKGNFMTAQEFLSRFPGNVFRMLVLSHHYRAPMDNAEESIMSAAKNISDMSAFVAKLKFVEKNGRGSATFDLAPHEQRFHAAMEDDFNTPEAVAVIFGLMNEVNKQIWNLSGKDARAIRLWLFGILKMFGFKDIDAKIPLKIRRMARKREISRVNKQFTQSDALRKELEALGYIIEDTPLGPLALPR